MFSHFQAMIIFALAVSAAFAFLTKRASGERWRYFLWAFFAFLLVAVAVGWIMYPVAR